MKNGPTFAQSLSPAQRKQLLYEVLELMTPEERAQVLERGASPKTPPDISLETLRDRREITQYALNCLYRAGMRTLHDVYSTSPKAIMNIRRVGKSTFSEIVEVLRKYEYDVSAFEMWEQKVK